MAATGGHQAFDHGRRHARTDAKRAFVPRFGIQQQGAQQAPVKCAQSGRLVSEGGAQIGYPLRTDIGMGAGAPCAHQSQFGSQRCQIIGTEDIKQAGTAVCSDRRLVGPPP